MNFDQFAARLRAVREALPAARERALVGAAEIVRDDAKDLIGQEYAGWPALADLTVQEKQRLGYTGQVSATDPLLRTGELRASIQVRDVTPERVLVATDDPIAGYQEFGTIHIMPRPFIGAAVFRMKRRAEARIGQTMAQALRGEAVDTGYVPMAEAAE